ncbi:hypothetical protein Gohar_008724 [Gossypium harknessii]|uniref:DUF4283 domain-containing protein n=1 Tax=Gossypium harknessii TaxID=34285 RepID=A0A7J9GLX3_9ROSI|nr:hypothetical protein [Gossypium harknessii]
MRSTINRVSAINFSERVHQILVKDMATTVVFHLMDVENRYFLVKFHSREAYEKVFTQGLWIVLGQFGYLQNLFPSVGSATNIVVGSDSTVGASSMNDKVAKPTEAFGS